MKEPYASCPRRELDFGGCRCQAFALTRDARATDPVCQLAPDHARVAGLAAVQTDAAYAYCAIVWYATTLLMLLRFPKDILSHT
jgi:PqqA peptide cyclase